MDIIVYLHELLLGAFFNCITKNITGIGILCALSSTFLQMLCLVIDLDHKGDKDLETVCTRLVAEF